MGSYSYYTNSTRVLLPGLDVVIIFGAFRLASYQQAGTWVFKGNYPLLFAVFALLWWILSDRYANIYRTNPLLSYGERFMRLFGTCLLHAGIVLSAAMLLATSWLSSSYLLTVYGLILAGVVAGRFLLTFLRRTFYQVIGQSRNSFVIVGVSPSAQEFHSFLASNNATDDQFRGFFTNDAVPAKLQPLVQGQVSALKEYCLKEQINDIYFALPLDQHELIEDLSRFADQHFISFRIIPDFQGTVRKDVNVYFYDHLPILTIRQNPLGFPTNQVVKRLFDICFSGAVILIVFPIILPILALLIKLDSPGPVFFKQLRPGKRHQLFPCYKLRTMRSDHGRAELQATAGDPRVTRIGAFLRKTSLDELPQFFNVLLGHMSVVGPRPNMISQLEEYSQHIHAYPLRHAVTPGITGYAQVNGLRGETRAEGAMEKRVEYDLRYIQDWSFGLDMKIIFLTVWNMVRGEKNAY